MSRPAPSEQLSLDALLKDPTPQNLAGLLRDARRMEDGDRGGAASLLIKLVRRGLEPSALIPAALLCAELEAQARERIDREMAA